jgi:hypothetical protein
MEDRRHPARRGGRSLLPARGQRSSKCKQEASMRFEKYSFGSVQINGVVYEYDVLIDRGEISKRKKKPSKKFREDFGHTPVSLEENIPWKCRRLVIGTGAYGRLSVMKEVKKEARRREIDLVVLPTIEAIAVLKEDSKKTNAILHVTC